MGAEEGLALSSRSDTYWPGDLGHFPDSTGSGKLGEVPGVARSDEKVPLTSLTSAAQVISDSEAPVPPDNPGGPKDRSAAEPCLRGRREVAAGPPSPRSSSASLIFYMGQP